MAAIDMQLKKETQLKRKHPEVFNSLKSLLVAANQESQLLGDSAELVWQKIAEVESKIESNK